ncbi:diguanylate cyclase domain-containing protein [Thiohalocapsa marina]|nr:diguanylate cyclase [Thiohalocapsa marina]
MDIQTLLFAITSTSMVLAITMGLIGYGSRHNSMTLWTLAVMLNATAFLAFILRPQIGEPVSVLVGNALITASLAVFAVGWSRFQGRQLATWLVWLPVPVTVIASLSLLGDIAGRVIANGAIVWLQCLFLLVLLLRGRRSTPGVGQYIVAAGLMMPLLIHPVRIIGVLLDPAAVVSLTSASPVQTLLFLASLHGLILMVIGIIVAVRERAEAELRLSEQKFRAYVEDAYDVIYTLNLKGEFQYLSPNLQEVLGHRPEDVIGRHFSAYIHSDDLPRCLAFLQRLLATREKQSGLEYRVRHKRGDWCWHMSNASPLLDDAGELVGMLGIGRDISDRKENEARISYLAHYDPLTDLPNRTLLFDRLQQALREAERDGTQVAVLFIDLDRFKPINDTHGHAIGDQVLQAAAARLLAAVRASDSVGRIGGDEFLVLLPRVDGCDCVLAVADKITAALCEPIAVDDLQLTLSCSVGAALYPRHGHDITSLVGHADQAMYRAKQAGRDQTRFGESDEAP